MKSLKSLKICLWDKTVGFLADTPNGIVFEFDEEFKKMNLNISPFELDLKSTTIYSSPNNSPTFRNLPGIFADSLPDIYGHKVIENFFLSQYGVAPNDVTALMRLAYLHKRAMGALEYIPNARPEKLDDGILSLATLVDAARKTIAGKGDSVVAEILRVGASAGGLKAKALIDYNPKTKEIRSGFNEHKNGFRPCLIKFDGVMDGEDPGYNGKLEYIYNQVAKKAGMDVPECYLLESIESDYKGELRATHFITERFDRDTRNNKPYHVATLCGLTLSDFRAKNSSNYESLFRTIKYLCPRDVRETEKAMKMCIFNIVLRNEDDHTKNFSFLMNQKGNWKMSPAYDLNYVRVKTGHQMSLGGKNQNITINDLIEVGKRFDIKEAKVRKMIGEVIEAANSFMNLAKEIDLPIDFAEGVKRNFNLIGS
jgi:serine/threonine-protein kinase HipA